MTGSGHGEEGGALIPAGPTRISALAGRLDLVQVAAAAAFLVLAASVVVLQVRSSVDLVGTLGSPGAKVGRRWWALYAVLAVAIAAGAAFLPRRLLWTPAALGGLALASSLAAVATAGGELWSMLAALLTLTASVALGTAALRARWLRRGMVAGSGMASLAAGLGLLGLGVFLFGVAGAIRWWTVGLLVLGLGAAGAVVVLRREGAALRRIPALWSSRLGAGALGILGLQGAYAAVWAGAPEIQWDALMYKAWLPHHWVGTGSIDADTFRNDPITVYLGLAQLDATPGNTLAGPGVGRYLQLFLAAVLVVYAWRVGSRIAPALGPVAALIVGTAPIVVWQASTAYDDLFLTALAVGAAAALLELGGRSGWSPVAASAAIGFLAGTCVTGKLHFIPFAAGIMLAWLLVSPGAAEAARRALGLGVGLVVGAAPVLAYRAAITGNPVFPYYNQIFESSYFPTGRGITDFTGGGGIAPWDWVWRLVEGVVPGNELPTRGVLGLLVPAAAVGLLFGWRGDRGRVAVWGATAIAVVFWWVQFRILRFVLPYAVLGTLLALPALTVLGRTLRLRAATAVALAASALAAAALIVATGSAFWNVPGRFPLAVSVGASSSDDYVLDVLPQAAAMRWLNDHAAPGDLIVGDSAARLLLRGDLRYELDHEFRDRFHLDASGANVDAAKAAAARAGVDWFLFGGDRGIRGSNALSHLLVSDGDVLYADLGYDVYRLDEPELALPVALCDPGLSLPECWFGGVPPDAAPGLTAQEVGGQPVGTIVAACAGATYRLGVTAGDGPSGWRAFFVFDVPEPEQALRSGDVLPSRTNALYQTAPAGSASMSIVLQPLASDAAPITGMSLVIAREPDAGPPCT